MRKILILFILLSLLEFAYAQTETEKYSCIEVKTDLENDKIRYSINRENTSEFTLKNCIPENLKIYVKNRTITYAKSRRLIEDGRIEKNDLFAIECYQPLSEDGNLADYEGINLNFYKGKISGLITPEYPLYPTLKQTSEKLNIAVPHRTFIIFNGFGGSSHEFFCYVDGKKLEKPTKDNCQYSFDEVLDIHAKNKNTVAISDLAEKYFKRQDYEKAEKAYKKLMEISKNSDYSGLLSIYIATGQYKSAEELLLKRLKDSPFDTLLYISLAKVYLYQKDYAKAKSTIQKALKLKFEAGEYEAHAILGEVYIKERKYQDAIDSFEKASKFFKKECEDKNLMMSHFFNRQETKPIDCSVQTIPYQLKIIYSLTELEDFKRAEKLVIEMLTKTPNDPHIYGHLAYVYAGEGQFDKALEMADKATSLLKRKGIGANIVMGEVYPMIVYVSKNTPAERAGLKKGDKIINLGDNDIRFLRENGDILRTVVDYINKNEKIKFKVYSENSIELKDLEQIPEEFLEKKASEVLAFKALILRIKGETSEFEKQSLKAYELNPEDKLTLTVMGLLKTDKGRYKEAVEILEKLTKYSNDSLILLIKPLIHAKAGEMDKAKEYYREIPEELLKTRNALYKRLLNEIRGELK